MCARSYIHVIYKIFQDYLNPTVINADGYKCLGQIEERKFGLLHLTNRCIILIPVYLLLSGCVSKSKYLILKSDVEKNQLRIEKLIEKKNSALLLHHILLDSLKSE